MCNFLIAVVILSQETFDHGEEPIPHMVCGGVGGIFKYLFTAARDGTIKASTVQVHYAQILRVSINRASLISIYSRCRVL